MINKIQVLLIDDLPTFALKRAKDTLLKDVKPFQKDSEVPFIAQKPYSDFFELRWIQNKEDLQLYKKLCTAIEDKHNSVGLGAVENAVSEIVLFDYALTGHEDASYLSEDTDKNLLEQLVPNYKLRQFWDSNNPNEELPIIDRIDINSSQISEGLNDDNIGCIGGIMAVTQFRNHPCIGIATSRKTDANIQGRDVQFLEALVKEPNQFNFSMRGDNSNLNWKSLLNNASHLLRKRIETLLQSKKITLNLPDLLQFVIQVPTTPAERVLTIQSAYGTRQLPLDGLFIDKEEDKRDNVIKTWIKSILRTYQREISTIDAAINKYDKIYSVFQKHFTDRILLSYFSKKEQDIFELTDKIAASTDPDEITRLQAEIDNLTYFFTKNDNEYEDKYNWLRKDVFKVVNGKITDSNVLCGVKQEFSSFTGNNKKVFPTHEARLVVLFLVTRLWIDYQITNEEKPLYPLETEDYNNVLNPAVNNNLTGLVLHMHSREGELSLSDYMGEFQSFLKNKKYFGIITKSIWSFDWTDDGEKQILKSFFQEQLTELSNKPEWLQ